MLLCKKYKNANKVIHMVRRSFAKQESTEMQKGGSLYTDTRNPGVERKLFVQLRKGSRYEYLRGIMTWWRHVVFI